MQFTTCKHDDRYEVANFKKASIEIINHTNPMEYFSSLSVCGKTLGESGGWSCSSCGRPIGKFDHRICRAEPIPRLRGVGSYLVAIIPAGACGACSNFRDKLNNHGPQWCRDNFAAVVAEIHQNALDHPSWTDTAEQIRHYLSKAIERAENAATSSTS